MLGLFWGFFGTLILVSLWLALTTNSLWHQEFHVKCGINRAFSFCDHCAADWIDGKKDVK
jgi:ABC-type uncharacterized transport system permease subunit